MKPLASRLLAASAIALGLFGAASAAQAHTDVRLSIGLGGLPLYAQPAPVYVQPQPVYFQPQPVVVEARPAYVFYRHDEGWRRAEWERQHHRVEHGRDWR